MTEQTDVFLAAEESARRGGDRNEIIKATALKLAATLRKDEIDVIRAERAILHAEAKRNPKRNGAIMTFDLHPLEYEACKILCPLLTKAHWGAKKEAWQWILNQPWGRQFKASDFEKTRF